MALDYEVRRNELKKQRDKEFIEFLKTRNDFTFGRDLENYRESKIQDRGLSIASLKLGRKSEVSKPRAKREYQPRLVDDGEPSSHRRKSLRICKRKRNYADDSSENDEENLLELDANWRFSAAPKRAKKGLRYSDFSPPPSIDLVTEQMLANVYKPGTRKRYSSLGTSCHQCRQKTIDQKTICRSGQCIGGRGMLCKTCLHNRYGEEIVTVLKDPHWHCPCCKGECNQSNCLRRVGLLPTGCLYPNIGTYSSVRDFLKGEKLFPLPCHLSDGPEKSDETVVNADGQTASTLHNNVDDQTAMTVAPVPVKVVPYTINEHYELVYSDDEEDFKGW